MTSSEKKLADLNESDWHKAKFTPQEWSILMVLTQARLQGNAAPDADDFLCAFSQAVFTLSDLHFRLKEESFQETHPLKHFGIDIETTDDPEPNDNREITVHLGGLMELGEPGELPFDLSVEHPGGLDYEALERHLKG